MSHFDILIVEDHPLMIRSITASLAVLHPQAHADCGVVTVGSLMQAKNRLLRRREPPGLVIADLNLPDSRGLATLRALREVAPGIAIVVFSASDDKSTEQAALDLGAQAFISKSALPQSFIQKLQPFLPGSAAPCGPALSVPASSGEVPHHPVDLLTERQRAVLAEVASGYRNREIALRLKIGEQTVSTHLNTIFQRLGVQNRTQASMQYMAWAQAHGMLG
ncbi:MAG: response regulator transcription factor [Hydrogenophaga sp.]|uniref:response regulator transcription factor n=1 Tax=Hydrogenophaga sp. TaxID=1904254 RepID=UPI0025C4E498|nr:response regulator transcription factor [Hydrogenophaga sp.]MBU7575003.1 response regulator transcription factor [Hydrogenophaga sp.]